NKDEAGGDEGERYPSWLAAAMHAALGPGTDRLDAGIETKQLTDDDPDENADQQHEWISGFERHLEADDDDEQPDRDPDAALQAVGDHPAECQADGGADDHRAGVQDRARTRYHAGSELFEAVDVHDEDGGATHLDLDRVGNEEVTWLDQGRHRVHELAARPAVFLDQGQHLFDPVIVDSGHQRHVLVLQESAGAGEAGDGDAAIVERIHGR